MQLSVEVSASGEGRKLKGRGKKKNHDKKKIMDNSGKVRTTKSKPSAADKGKMHPVGIW